MGGTSKLGAQVRIKEEATNEVVERVFQVYRRLLLLHCQEKNASPINSPGFYKRNSDGLPHLEDINKLQDATLNPDAFALDAFLDMYGRQGLSGEFLHSE